MQNELEILKWVEKNQNTTQRDIAERIGISLGNVNVIINRLVDKGMLEIERINSRTRYIITSKGLKKKTEEIYKKYPDCNGFWGQNFIRIQPNVRKV